MSVRRSSELRLGFIALTDCAPLVVASERGLFAAEGLDVELCREASWANIRDKVGAGLLDGAHMLGPMALATSIGAGGECTPMVAPLALNLNGSAITVSKALANALRDVDPVGMAERPRSAHALALAIEARRSAGERPLVFAAVFPFSMHAYELRYWMAAAGVDPDRDVRLVITPPARMAAQLRAGEIDGFCVGAPWNAVSVAEGAGEILIHATEFWRGGPDKVFAVTADWAKRNPEVLLALVRSLMQAAAWADDPDNRDELAALLARPDYVGVPARVVRQSLDGVTFYRNAANFPWRSHALWFLTQMRRWGQIGPDVDLAAVAQAVYQPDLYRRAAADIGVPAPAIDAKIEGGHIEPWVLTGIGGAIPMEPDRFIDNRIFDPAGAQDYVSAFEVVRTRR